ncbi:MAG: adenylate kinase [Chloroflexota bacterium]
MYIVLLGAPGAGKGTQAANLARRLGAVHISTGDLFRNKVKEATELGLLLKSYMDKGLLVPDEITVRLLLEEIEGAKGAKGVIFDGFPRNLAQAEALDEALKERGKKVERAIYIRVSSEELVRRLSGRFICRACQAPYQVETSPPKVSGRCDRCGGELYQRDDDAPATVRKRLEVYLAEASALNDYYARQGKLAEVNGEGSPEEIGERIMAVLETVGKRG